MMQMNYSTQKIVVPIMIVGLGNTVFVRQLKLICVLGRQANLKETSKGKELAKLRLQVLVVVITSDAYESKKEIMRLKSGLQSEDHGACY
jgi:hypothetical protein